MAVVITLTRQAIKIRLSFYADGLHIDHTLAFNPKNIIVIATQPSLLSLQYYYTFLFDDNLVIC